MGGNHLLMIDDDLELCELLKEYLANEGFDVEATHAPGEGLEQALSGQFDLIVLDVMLPGMSGFEVLRRLRRESAVPVLMLTARGDDVDRIVGLEMGADDYLPKPFNPRELVARIRAVQRRSGDLRAAAGELPESREVVVGDVVLDPGARTVRASGRVIDVTSVEFDVLALMLRAAGTVVPRDHLARNVLGRELSAYDRSVDVHVSNLRRKLGQGPNGDPRIKTVRGVGYLYALDSHPPPSSSPTRT